MELIYKLIDTEEGSKKYHGNTSGMKIQKPPEDFNGLLWMARNVSRPLFAKRCPQQSTVRCLGTAMATCRLLGWGTLAGLQTEVEDVCSPKEQTPQTEVSLTPSHGMYVILTAAGVHGGCCLQMDGTVQVRQV